MAITLTRAHVLTAPNIGVVIDYYIVCMIESHDFGILVTPLVQGGVSAI